MRLLCKAIRHQFNGNMEHELILTLKDKLPPEYNDLKEIADRGKALAVEIKQHRNKRSLDANSYMWVLCQKIAEVVRTTKEEVYKKAIREVGQFEILPIKNEAVNRWIEVWNGKGLGWFAEVMEDSKLPGYKKVISYYGSSVYDSREMSVLIDYIVDECRELGIETMPPEELESLKQQWGDKGGKDDA